MNRSNPPVRGAHGRFVGWVGRMPPRGPNGQFLIGYRPRGERKKKPGVGWTPAKRKAAAKKAAATRKRKATVKKGLVAGSGRPKATVRKAKKATSPRTQRGGWTKAKRKAAGKKASATRARRARERKVMRTAFVNPSRKGPKRPRTAAQRAATRRMLAARFGRSSPETKTKRKAVRRYNRKNGAKEILMPLGAGLGAFFGMNLLDNLVHQMTDKMEKPLPAPVLQYGVPVVVAALVHFVVTPRLKLTKNTSYAILGGLAASAVVRNLVVGMMAKLPGVGKYFVDIDTLGAPDAYKAQRLAELTNEGNAPDAGLGRYLYEDSYGGGMGRYVQELPGSRPQDSLPGRGLGKYLTYETPQGMGAYLNEGGQSFYEAPAGVGAFYEAPAGIGELMGKVTEANGLTYSELAVEGVSPPPGQKAILLAPEAANALQNAGAIQVVKNSNSYPGAVVAYAGLAVTGTFGPTEVTAPHGSMPGQITASPFSSPFGT